MCVEQSPLRKAAGTLADTRERVRSANKRAEENIRMKFFYFINIKVAPDTYLGIFKMKYKFYNFLLRKKIINGIAIIGITLIASCSSSKQSISIDKKSETAFTEMVELNEAIRMVTNEINDLLFSGTKVALLNFTSSSDVFSDYVIEEMSIHLVKGKKLIVVDRKEIDLIRGEMRFQMSGEVSDESMQEMGRLLGAQSIISGSLVSMGDSYRFRSKVINVQNASIEVSSSVTIKDSPQVRHLLSQNNSKTTTTPSKNTTTGSESNKVGTKESDGVTINGITWATKNVGATNPEDYGKYFDRERTKTACPEGWYLPSEEDFKAILNYGTWTRQKGKYGLKIEENGNFFFLPAAGYYMEPHYIEQDKSGFYRSSTAAQGHAFFKIALEFNKDTEKIVWDTNYGQPVRCIKE